MRKNLAVPFLIRAWEMVTPHVLEQAWSAHFDDDDEPEWRKNISNSFEEINAVHIVAELRWRRR
jgi:hypothetical protein